MEFRRVFEERWFNVPNLLSVTRVFMIPFFAVLGRDHARNPGSGGALLGLVLIVAGVMLTDMLDGFLARHLNQETMMGRYLDPIADKLTSVTALVVLSAYYDFPLWVLVFFFIREILGVWGGTYLYFKRDMQGRPNIWGKVGVFWIAGLTLWYILHPWLGTRLPAGHILLTSPIYGAYGLVLILALGIVSYWRSYAGIVFGWGPKSNKTP